MEPRKLPDFLEELKKAGSVVKNETVGAWVPATGWTIFAYLRVNESLVWTQIVEIFDGETPIGRQEIRCSYHRKNDHNEELEFTIVDVPFSRLLGTLPNKSEGRNRVRA